MKNIPAQLTGSPQFHFRKNEIVQSKKISCCNSEEWDKQNRREKRECHWIFIHVIKYFKHLQDFQKKNASSIYLYQVYLMLLRLCICLYLESFKSPSWISFISWICDLSKWNFRTRTSLCSHNQFFFITRKT